jgi:hypothetical protein
MDFWPTDILDGLWEQSSELFSGTDDIDDLDECGPVDESCDHLMFVGAMWRFGDDSADDSNDTTGHAVESAYGDVDTSCSNSDHNASVASMADDVLKLNLHSKLSKISPKRSGEEAPDVDLDLAVSNVRYGSCDKWIMDFWPTDILDGLWRFNGQLVYRRNTSSNISISYPITIEGRDGIFAY